MAVSQTSLMRYIKRHLGASHRPLPIDDEEIIEIINDESLVTYSKYFPYLYDITVTPNDAVPGTTGRYFIDVDGLEVLGIFNTYRTSGNPFLEGFPGQYVNPTDGIQNQLINNLASYTQVPTTFEFLPPNVMEIFPKYIYNENIMVTVKCVHPSHLATIPLSMRDEFYKLCLYDVKIALWHILKQYSGLNTAVGSIDLKIEDYEAAEAERKDLLERWDEHYNKDALRKKIWVG